MALHESYEGPVESYLAADSSVTRVTQTFITTSTHDINFISFWLYRDEATGAIAFELRDTDGGGEPDNLLKSGAIPQGNVPVGEGNAAWVTLEISPYSVSDATKYALILYHNTEESLFAGRSSLNGGDSGQSGLSEDAGSSWQMSVTFDLLYRIMDESSNLPTDPTPANNDTDVDFSGFQLSWEYVGGEDTFDVYVGETGNLILVSEGQEEKTYTTIIAELETIFGISPIDQKIYWRVDVVIGGDATEGTEWNFDPRPAKASSPSPSNTATGTVLGLTTTWTGSDIADTFDTLADVGAGLVSQSTGLESATWTPSPTIFDYVTEYTWRVDSTNVFGTTTGDEWSFTTIRLDPPSKTYFYATTGQYYYLLIQSDGSYGDPPGVGVENTDYVYLALGYEANFVSTTRKLVAAAENRIWYEDI